MGFFGISGGGRGRQAPRGGVSDEFLHRNECAACPLNNQAGLAHPHMEPTGAAHPLAYFLGEAPGKDEDRKGEQFVGSAGRILRHHLPHKYLDKIRWNNVVRTRPPKNRTPARVEVEACRPSITRDIEASDPRAIVGFGNVPLSWAGIGESGITLWSGRRTPIMVGGRARWFFPIIHPSAVQYDAHWHGVQSPGRYGSEIEFQFALHMRRALGAIEAGLPEPIVHTREDAERNIEWVDGSGGHYDVARVAAHLRRAARRRVAGIDYETQGLRPYADGAKILTASVTTEKDGTLAFPFDHRGAKWSPSQRVQIDELWSEFLYDPYCRKIAHHLAFEMEWSAYFYGSECIWSGSWGDSYAQAYVLDPQPGTHSLSFLVRQHFGLDVKKLFSLNMSNLDGEPLEKVLRYNGPDSKYALLLYLVQVAELRQAGLLPLYQEHVQRVPTAVLTQLKGVPINQAAALRLGEQYIPRMLGAQRAMHGLEAVKEFERATGKRFRPSANEDVKRVANEGLGYKLASVDEAALETVDHEFAREMIKWRKAAKIYGTYVTPTSDVETRASLNAQMLAGLREINGPGAELPEAKPSQVYSDGLAHPQTKVNRTKTSRTSADDFNYQNWPKRGAADAIEVRGIVRPLKSDEVLVSFDYGSIQFRNVGMESLDRNLLAALWNDYDVHMDFMEQAARLYPRWVKEGVKALAHDKALVKKYRNIAKNKFVFPSCFGAQPKSKAEGMGVPIGISEKMHDIFFDRFGGIGNWHAKLRADYYKTGYVTGLSGYRRQAPVGFNELINSPIQADEAKIVLDAMVRMSKLQEDLLQPIMEIHDDLTFVWPKKQVDALTERVLPIMLAPPFAWARVTPIVVERAIGADWASLKDAGVFSSHRYDGIDMPKECPI